MTSRKLLASLVVLAVTMSVTAPPASGGGDPDPVNNNQPDITLPSSVSTDIGTPVSFAPTVSDPDVGLGNMELEIDISDLDGAAGRSVSAGDYGTFTYGGGTAVTSDVEVEPLASVNADLATFTYNPPPGFAGLARIVFEIDDQGNTGLGGELARTRFLDITVAAAGDADPATNNQPDITLPGPLSTNTGTPISFAPTVSDPDVGPGDMEMEIDISDLDGGGPLSVPAGDYGTFTWGGGAGLTSDIELEPLLTTNADLATFTYTPPVGFTGLARIVFEIDDQGNSGSEFPPNVLARTRFIDITVAPTADVEVTKTAPASVVAGENLSYEITVTNNGPGEAQGLDLTDILPPGTTFVSLAQTVGPPFTLVTPSVGGTGSISATAPTFADGATAIFTLTVEVGESVVHGTTISNTASATTTSNDADPANNSDEAETDVENQADVSIAKSGPATVDEGDTVTYDITVINAGPAAAQDVVITDPLPAGTTFVSVAQTSGPPTAIFTPAVGATGSFTATIANLPAGATLLYELVVATSPGTGTTSLTNTATVTSSIADPDTSNNTASIDTDVEGADLVVTKDAPALVELGEPITYQVSVTNDGPADAQDVALSDVLPAGTTFVSATQTGGPAATLVTPPVGGTGTVSATMATLADGATATFEIVVMTSAGTEGASIVNTATVASATGESDTSDNADAATTAVLAADLAITKTADESAVAGESLTYALAVTNDGPSDTTDVVVTDELPEGTTFVSATFDDATTVCELPAVGETGTVTCTIADLGDGGSADIEITVLVDSGAADGSTVTNTASAGSAIVDPAAGNDSASAATDIETAADVEATKTGPDTAVAGSDITYQLSITNDGPSDAQTVELSDELPAGTTFVSITQDAGPAFDCETPAVGATGTVTCSIAALADGATAEFSLVLHVGDTVAPGTSISNTAVAASATVDPEPEGNTVVAGAALVLSASAVPPTTPGATGPLPVTGADPTGPLGIALLLVLFGAALVVLSSARARPRGHRLL